MRKFLSIISAIVLITAFSSCEKDNTGQNQTRFRIFLTDAPGDYDKVLIDIQGLEIHTEDSGWISLPLSRAGQYDILKFSAGKDTILAGRHIPAGKISQLRLILGNNNFVEIDDTLFSLTTPSGQQSGLKINIHSEFLEGIDYEMWLDFDASRSIVKTGSGKYILKPVMRLYSNAIGGAIKGDIDPDNAAFYVMAIATPDTFGTTVLPSGEFLIGGVPPGSYNIEIVPNTGFAPKTINGVGVTLNNVTDMGKIGM